MKRNKIIFIIAAVIFLIALLAISYDISKRTTFPGSKPQLQERILKSTESKEDQDTLSTESETDTIKN